MLVVADTNVLISGLLWMGLPHRLIELAEQGAITLCATETMLEELQAVLSRPKFAQKIQERQSSVEEIVLGVIRLVALYPPPPMVKAILADPEDDVFVSCALNAGATYLVSGDQHLLELGQYAGVKILTVREFLEREFPECLAA